MIKFNFLFAIRHLIRDWKYSILNLTGLTIGLASAILLLINVLYNLNYDRFHENFSNLYTLSSWIPDKNNKGGTSDFYSALIGPLIKEQVPEVEAFTRFTDEQFIFKAENQSFLEKGMYADNNFFKIFSFPLKDGNKNTVLLDNNSIVISESMSKKFFGAQNSIGRALTLKKNNTYENFQVAGIFEDVPDQSTIKFDFIIPFSKFLTENQWANKISSTSSSIWLLFKKNANRELVNSKINKVISDKDPVKGKKNILISLKEKHLYSFMFGKRTYIGAILDVIIFSTIATIILLLACFNFMNLAIALTVKRYNEAGIKKSLGSSRRNIIFQFLGETMIISFLSLALALLIVALLLPSYIALMPGHRPLTIPFHDYRIILFFVGIAITTGFISGIYPAVLLSSSKAINILKNNFSFKVGMNYFRQGLIVFQFFISVVFIILSFVVWKQASYLKTKDLGINKDNILVLENHENLRKHQTTFKNELLSLKEVSSVCFSNSRPFNEIRSSAKVDWPEKDRADNITFQLLNTDFDFMKTMQPVLLEGRFFEESLSTDPGNFIINEAALQEMNVKNPIGHTISVNGAKGTIIGMVKNFHTHSLFVAHLPLIIRIAPLSTDYTIVKFLPGYKNTLLANLKNKYKQFESDFPFEAEFASDIYNRQNNRDPAAILTGLFASIAIFLACFGLYGLSSFTTEKRTKEIGIRKINGATVTGLVILLLRNYTKWIITSACLGIPVAFLLAKGFLGIFAFRVDLPYWALFIGPLIVFCIALLTMFWKTIKASIQNPAKALRYE